MKNEDQKTCGICSIPHFERNNYFYGKLLTERDFVDEQCYFNEKRWLINRMILGWGVVCGLDVVAVKDDPTRVLVQPGMAIDCCGREILVCQQQEVPLIARESECDREKSEKGGVEKELAICLEFHECRSEPLPMSPLACDRKGKCEFNRIRDSFRISVIPLPQHEHRHQPFCPRSHQDQDKSLHNYLCDRLRDGCPECGESRCVILATLKVNQEGAVQIDSCSRRKLVYSNQLLYDLIDCYHGDLPHIDTISWSHGKQYEWVDFLKLIKAGLEVTFSKPLLSHTIDQHTFLLAAILEDEGTGYRVVKYIPAGKIAVESENIDGQVCTRTARSFVESGWGDDELLGAHSELRHGARFEIILRGNSIMGREGKALDGDFIGGRLPTGNGTQGGDFVSWFSVGAKQIKETSGKKKAA